MVTKNFIKMCEKNEDLQKGHKWKDSDKLAYRRCINVRDCDYEELIKHPEYYEMTYATRKIYENIDIDKPIYLPTLEWLFEKVKPNYDDDWKVIICFRNWIIDQIRNTKKRITFMDYNIKELLLLWVMHEKYHKIWTGEKWGVCR